MIESAINKALLPEFRLNENEIKALDTILEATLVQKSRLLPSNWYESKMVMPANDSFPGPVQFSRTPYWEEPFNCIDPNDPTLNITIVGPAQMGKSVMVLNAIIAYVISENPVNILFLTGHSKLSKESMEKIDFVIKCCGLDHLITPNVLKKRNSRSGDTSEKKEFRGADLKSGSITNHNLLRQNTARITLSDDLDAGQLSKDQTGSTIRLIEGRTKASEDKSKRYWVSTPQVRGSSLIEIQFEKSDKRYWNVECPHCGTSEKRITWKMPHLVNDKDTAGLFWKLDNIGRVDIKSVGYVCQLCAAFFTDKNKHEMLNSGIWIPTVEPKEFYHKGYHITGLYAPHGMTSWFSLASKFEYCNPPGQPRREADWQTVVNIDIGDWYDMPGTSVDSSQLEKNIRTYPIGTVPDEQSVADGNGHIVLLTLVLDLGGRYVGDQLKSDYDDARADWEIVGHAENGTTYSINHGSIGTFTNAYLGKKDEGRELWSYDLNKPNNVWKIVDQLAGMKFPFGKGTMAIQLTGIDSGFADHHVFNYIESRRGRFRIVALKGDKENKPVAYGLDRKHWKDSASRSNQFILQVGNLKDILASRISLNWDGRSKQPAGFMNFPQRGDGKYERENYFAHYEAEHRVVDAKKGTFIWEKKKSTVQNHHFDLAVYTMALREILMYKVFKEIKEDPKEGTWREFSEWLLGQYGLNSALM